MPIVARELTPRGAGGVSVLQVRGAGALARVRGLLVGERELPTGRPLLVRLNAGGEDLDEALVCAFGEDEVELHVHGSPPLVRRLLRELGAAGDAQGEPRVRGPVEDAALARLADAPCAAAARILLDQAEGALRRDVLAACALPAPERRAAFDALIERGRRAQPCLVPLEVVLAGPVNAGKSTLFNVLVGERRVVVSAEEGTTRDRVREPARLGPWPIFLSDTAGERELPASDPDPQRAVERIGQDRSRAARARSDLVLWLVPADGGAAAAHAADRPGSGPQPGAGPRTVRIVTRRDLAPAGAPGAPGDSDVALSALRDPEHARATVLAVFRRAFDLPADPWRPGAGVPFERDHLERLGRLAELGAAAGAPARGWLDGDRR